MLRENVVLVGAGSAVFTRGLLADVIRQGWEGEIRLVDTDPGALEVAEGLARKMVAAAQAPLTIRASIDRCDVLPGATAVVCTVGVGGRRAWETDVVIPRGFDVFQPVGDSVMPGGTSRALRMIPAMVAIAEDVVALCPDALFFNYGNPMAPVCRAVHKATGANLVGLCHGVFHVADHIASALGTTRDSIRYTAVGMNHLTWFTELRTDGADAMPALRRIARRRLGISEDLDGPRQDPDPDHLATMEEPFTWQLVDLFGAFPAVFDRHVTEFFPHMFRGRGSYQGKTLGLDVYSVEATIEAGDARFEQMKEDALSETPLALAYLEQSGGEHEQVTEIIQSIRGDIGHVYSVNVPNRGQVPNIPDGIVLECPAVADGTGVRPLCLPPMEAGIHGTLASRFQWVETTVDAALTGSRETFVQALLLDGAVTSIAQARQLADALLVAQREHLPQFVGP